MGRNGELKTSKAQAFEYRIRAPENPLQEDPDIDEDIVYRITLESNVTDTQLETCAEHFSKYFGVWSETAWRKMGVRARPGIKVQLSPCRLRAQRLPEGATNILITAETGAGRQVGHCFVSQWKHGNDRVWWITQLLVLPSYRNQRRATRMLQALVMYCDIGRTSSRKDFVGVATSHPYTICAVLRVFARGIESLPSKLDWERTESLYHPLHISRCVEILKGAPVKTLRESTPSQTATTINTSFFIDHTVPERALHRVIFGMNKQMAAPWLWLFGKLHEGHEYLCVLDYRYDPRYKVQRTFCEVQKRVVREIASEVHKRHSFARPTQASKNRSTTAASLNDQINYAELDQFLLNFPAQLHQNLTFLYRTRMSMAERTGEKRIIAAKELLLKHGTMLEMTMDAKRIPESLRSRYSIRERPLPRYQCCWKELKEYTQEVLHQDDNMKLRLLVLQAVHFKELLDEHAGLHGELQRSTKHNGRPEISKHSSTVVNATKDLARSAIPKFVRTLTPIPASFKISRLSGHRAASKVCLNARV